MTPTSFENAAKAFESETEGLENSPPHSNLRKLAQSRREKVIKNIGPASQLVKQIIQKEKAIRSKNQKGDNSSSNEKNEKITNLENQIKTLEDELKNTPNLDINKKSSNCFFIGEKQKKSIIN